MTFVLRYMEYLDVTQVVAIDKQAFSLPWPARSYAFEIGESTHSYMVVLDSPQDTNGWRKLVQTLGGGDLMQPRRQILAYGGLWNVMEEAHISTIATHPDWRRNGFGELVLAGMIRRAIRLSAEYIVLEVRVSNESAQRLYRKYEFEVFGVKRDYYSDDHEDAYDMRLQLDDPAMIERFEQRFVQLQQRLDFVDRYTETPRPRSRSRSRF
jgi:[ribosomal protein S18]-alanine N-acetyltransferase